MSIWSPFDNLPVVKLSLDLGHKLTLFLRDIVSIAPENIMYCSFSIYSDLLYFYCSQFQVFTFQEKPLYKALTHVGISPLSNPPCSIKDCYTVILNGKIVGYISDEMATQVEQKLRVMKVKGLYEVYI